MRSSRRDRFCRVRVAALVIIGLGVTASARADDAAAGREWHQFDAGIGLGALNDMNWTALSVTSSFRVRLASHLALEAEAGRWGARVNAYRADHGTTEVGGDLLFVSNGRVGPFAGLGFSKSWAATTFGTPPGFTYQDDMLQSYINFVVGVDVRVSRRVFAFASARFAPRVIGDYDGWYSIKRYQAGVRMGFD